MKIPFAIKKRLRSQFISAIGAIIVFSVIKFWPIALNTYDDFMATADKTTSDAELRKKFADIIQINQFMEGSLGSGLRCIANEQLRMQTAVKIINLTKNSLPYDTWMQSNYTRKEIQKSIYFFSSPVGQEYVKVYLRFVQILASQVKIDQEGHAIPSSMETVKKDALSTLSNVVDHWNFIEKEQFHYFAQEGLGKKFEALNFAMLKAVGDIIDTAEVQNPGLDQQIRPLLEPYYNHYNREHDDSCRQSP